MAENKTKPTQASVSEFIASIDNPTRREDCKTMLKLMRDATGHRPKMWGSIVGYGQYHYRYESGREGESMLTGFSPRKQNLVVYVMPGFKSYAELLKQLGKYKTGSSCLYINKLSDVDLDVLARLISESVAEMRNRYPKR